MSRRDRRMQEALTKRKQKHIANLKVAVTSSRGSADSVADKLVVEVRDTVAREFVNPTIHNVLSVCKKKGIFTEDFGLALVRAGWKDVTRETAFDVFAQEVLRGMKAVVTKHSANAAVMLPHIRAATMLDFANLQRQADNLRRSIEDDTIVLNEKRDALIDDLARYTSLLVNAANDDTTMQTHAARAIDKLKDKEQFLAGLVADGWRGMPAETVRDELIREIMNRADLRLMLIYGLSTADKCAFEGLAKHPKDPRKVGLENTFALQDMRLDVVRDALTSAHWRGANDAEEVDLRFGRLVTERAEALIAGHIDVITAPVYQRLSKKLQELAEAGFQRRVEQEYQATKANLSLVSGLVANYFTPPWSHEHLDDLVNQALAPNLDVVRERFRDGWPEDIDEAARNIKIGFDETFAKLKHILIRGGWCGVTPDTVHHVLARRLIEKAMAPDTIAALGKMHVNLPAGPPEEPGAVATLRGAFVVWRHPATKDAPDDIYEWGIYQLDTDGQVPKDATPAPGLYPEIVCEERAAIFGSEEDPNAVDGKQLEKAKTMLCDRIAHRVRSKEELAPIREQLKRLASHGRPKHPEARIAEYNQQLAADLDGVGKTELAAKFRAAKITTAASGLPNVRIPTAAEVRRASSPKDFDEMCMRWGVDLWEETYKVGMSDEVARDFIDKRMAAAPEEAQRGGALLDMARFSAQWAVHAFQRLQTSHTFGDAMMGTTTKPECYGDLKVAWSAFMIHVPTGRLVVRDGDRTTEIARILVAFLSSRVHIHIISFPGEEWWSDSAETMAALFDEKRDPVDSPLGRARFLAKRLTVGLLFAIQNSPSNAKQRTVAAKRSYRGSGRQDEPEHRFTVVGHPLRVDVRDAIDSYIATGRYERAVHNGDGSATSVRRGPPLFQSYVHAHQTHQPYGPRHSLRKVMWIEGYWRGPKDAPILSRTRHVVRADETNDTQK